jgi:hypothetical protein
MGTKCFLIDSTTAFWIYEVYLRGMLLFTRSVPWVLKACTVGVVILRAFSAGGASGRHTQVLAPVAFVTLASVLPSVLCCVIDRRLTTAYIVQSVLFLLCTHATLVGLEVWQVPQYQVALTQTCVLHMLTSQWQTLDRQKHVLIYQAAVKFVLAVMAMLSWGACALMMPHLQLDMLALGCLMFVGEILGVVVSFFAAVLVAVGDTMEAFLVEK